MNRMEDQRRAAMEAGNQDSTTPEGFEAQGEGWYLHPKYKVLWQSATRAFYRFNEATQSLVELPKQASVDKELKVSADASCVHRHERFREDRNVIVRDLAKAAQALKMPIEHLAKPVALFAIYDGHRAAGGAAAGSTEEQLEQSPPTCAEFCARNFHLKLLPRLSDFKGPWGEAEIARAITDSFLDVDSEFLSRQGSSSDGCSAVIALLTGARLFVANAGDAVALLGEQPESGPWRFTRLAAEHTLGSAEETRRVAAAGGDVSHDVSGGQRVLCAQSEDGKVETLHVSRALGNRAFKESPVPPPPPAPSDGEAPPPPPPPPPKNALVATPDITVTVLNASHRVLLLGCAELQQLPDELLAEVLAKRQGRPRMAAKVVLQEAQRRDLKGSLTAICAFLDFKPPAVQVAEPPSKKPKPDAAAQGKGGQVRCRQIMVKHKGCKEPIDVVRGNKPVVRTLAEAEAILVETLEAIESKPGSNVFTQRCKTVSECNSCMKGGEMTGDLGWMSRGQYHPAVEAAAFNLPVGHISDIIESDEGVHVLWRIA